jgi:hypothetical protein
MNFFQRLLGAFAEPEPAEDPAQQPVREAASAQGGTADEVGWTRLTGDGTGSANRHDLTPISQDRMQRLTEYLWQSNLLANRLTELPLAYLLAEGVTISCPNEKHQQLLDAFWNDPINNWPGKLEARVRDLALTGEQCYIVHVNEASGFLRLGYLNPRQINHVVMDPDNPEQPIGVITKKDSRGRYLKYRVAVMGEDSDLFTQRTAQLRDTDFTDGECLLYQVNKLPTGTRGRADMLAQIDWLDAYDEFLFGEMDRQDFLRRFVWDVKMTGATPDQVTAYEKTFKAPAPNSKFVHNDSVELTAVTPTLNAADTSETARLFRNHSLGGATMPETWFGGGGDVNRAAASEMGEPTFKVYTARQMMLKRMLEEIGRFVLWKAVGTTEPDWAKPEWKVTATFPELVNRDVTKFSAALLQVTSAVVVMIDNNLLTQERGLQLIGDVASRFGQEIDAKAELEKARGEALQRRQAQQAEDAFRTPREPAPTA